MSAIAWAVGALLFILTAGIIGADQFRKNRVLMGIVVVLTACGTAATIYFIAEKTIAMAEFIRRAPTVLSADNKGFKLTATYSQELDGLVPVIVIKGRILNETDRELTVPRVRLAVRDTQSRELYHWTVQPDQPRLRSGEEGTFSARLESPPSEAADLEVRLSDGRG